MKILSKYVDNVLGTATTLHLCLRAKIGMWLEAEMQFQKY